MLIKEVKWELNFFFLVDRSNFQQLKNTHDLASDLQNFRVLVAQSYWDKQKKLLVSMYLGFCTL